MSRDWSKAQVLQTVKEVQAYLRERYGIRLSRRTIYRYATQPLEFVPLTLHPPGRPPKGPGTRGVIPVSDIDAWVAARFHVAPRAPVREPTNAKRPA